MRFKVNVKPTLMQPISTFFIFDHSKLGSTIIYHRVANIRSLITSSPNCNQFIWMYYKSTLIYWRTLKTGVETWYINKIRTYKSFFLFWISAQICLTHGFMDSSTENKVNLIIESTTLIPNRAFRCYANGVGMNYLCCEQTNRYELTIV